MIRRGALARGMIRLLYWQLRITFKTGEQVLYHTEYVSRRQAEHMAFLMEIGSTMILRVRVLDYAATVVLHSTN
jgi:hypothetical protein